MPSVLAPSLALLSTGTFALAITSVHQAQAPIYKKIIPEEYLKISADGTVLYGFNDDVNVLDISRDKYNTLRIPETVTKINDFAFASLFDGSSCSISEIDFNPNLQTIGDHAFYRDTGIQVIETYEPTPPGVKSSFPSQLKYIGQAAFWGCSIEGNMVFPEGLEHIGNHAFFFCEKIKSIKLPTSLKTVGQFAFGNDFMLSTVDLTSYDRAPSWILEFSHCFSRIGTQLVSRVPKAVKVSVVKTTNNEWLSYLKDRQDMPFDEGCTFEIVTDEVELQEKYLNIEKKEDDDKTTYTLKGVNAGFDDAIKNCTVLTIPDRVTHISKNVFSGDHKITTRCELRLNSSLEEIGSGAFRDCTGLIGNLSLPDSTTKIGNYAFSNCRFSEVAMTTSLKYVGSNLFDNNPSLVKATYAMNTEVKTDDSYKSQQVFRNCPNLQYIDFSPLGTALSNDQKNFLKRLSGNARMFIPTEVAPSGFIISQCYDIDYLLINTWKFTYFDPDNPDAKWYYYKAGDTQCDETYIDLSQNKQVVKGMTSEGVKYLSDYNLVELPQTTKFIVNEAFNQLFNRDIVTDQRFWQINFNEGLDMIGDYAFYQCTGLEQLFNFPSTLTTIGDSAFAQCTGLRGIFDLPESLTHIGNNAFMGCTNCCGNLKLHGNLSIGDGAFMDTNFESFKITTNQPMTFGSRIFAFTSSIKTIDLTACSYIDAVNNWTYSSDSLVMNSVGAKTDNKVLVNNAGDINNWTALLTEMGLPMDHWTVQVQTGVSYE